MTCEAYWEKVHGRLAGRVGAADDHDVLADALGGLPGAGPVVEAGTQELLLVDHPQAPPTDTGGADVGSGPHDAPVGEVDPEQPVGERAFEATAHLEEFCTEPDRLLPSTSGELGAGDACGEPEVVLD